MFIIQPYVSDFIFDHPLSFTSRFVQMIGSYIHPGKPGDYLALYLTCCAIDDATVANMYFVLYGYKPYALIIPYDCNVYLLIRSRSALVFSRARVGQSNPDRQTRTVTARFEVWSEFSSYQKILRVCDKCPGSILASKADWQSILLLRCLHLPRICCATRVEPSSQPLRRNYETLMNGTY